MNPSPQSCTSRRDIREQNTSKTAEGLQSSVVPCPECRSHVRLDNLKLIWGDRISFAGSLAGLYLALEEGVLQKVVLVASVIALVSVCSLRDMESVAREQNKDSGPGSLHGHRHVRSTSLPGSMDVPGDPLTPQHLTVPRSCIFYQDT